MDSNVYICTYKRDNTCVCASGPFVLRKFVRHTSLQNNVNGGVEPWSLVTKGKTLVIKGNDLGDEREDLDDQRKDLNESKAAMPQRVKQTGWAKPNQLPAGPRKKRRLCRRLFSSV